MAGVTYPVTRLIADIDETRDISVTQIIEHGTLHLSDHAARYATWTNGVHRRRFATRRLLENVLLTICLLAGTAVLLLGLRLPGGQAGALQALALMTSGGLFATFILGMLSRL